MNALAISAASTGSQGTSPSAAHASAVPTSTGVTERESVRGRAAMIQGHDFIAAGYIGEALEINARIVERPPRQFVTFAGCLPRSDSSQERGLRFRENLKSANEASANSTRHTLVHE